MVKDTYFNIGVSDYESHFSIILWTIVDNRGQSWTQLAHYFLVPPLRTKIFVRKVPFHHTSNKCGEK